MTAADENGRDIPEKCPAHAGLREQVDLHEKRLDKGDEGRNQIRRDAERDREKIRKNAQQGREALHEKVNKVRDRWTRGQAIAFSVMTGCIGALIASLGGLLGAMFYGG